MNNELLKRIQWFLYRVTCAENYRKIYKYFCDHEDIQKKLFSVSPGFYIYISRVLQHSVMIELARVFEGGRQNYDINKLLKDIEISDTLFKGKVTELKCLTYFLEHGYIVSVPEIPCQYDFLIEWNNKFNLTSITDKKDVEINTILTLFNNGLITLGEAIKAVSVYYPALQLEYSDSNPIYDERFYNGREIQVYIFRIYPRGYIRQGSGLQDGKACS